MNLVGEKMSYCFSNCICVCVHARVRARVCVPPLGAVDWPPFCDCGFSFVFDEASFL